MRLYSLDAFKSDRVPVLKTGVTGDEIEQT